MNFIKQILSLYTYWFIYIVIWVSNYSKQDILLEVSFYIFKHRYKSIFFLDWVCKQIIWAHIVYIEWDLDCYEALPVFLQRNVTHSYNFIIKFHKSMVMLYPLPGLNSNLGVISDEHVLIARSKMVRLSKFIPRYNHMDEYYL